MSASHTNFANLTAGWLPYDTAHYRTTGARDVAARLRAEGRTVRLGSYVKDGGQSYCKIYVKID